MGKREAWNTILVFCILTFGFTAATIIKPSDDFSETENRSLAQMPKLTGKNILDGTFESDYESYLTDQFILRDAWIGLKTDVERLAMKKESKDIYFADDDYLIEKHTGSFTTTQAERNIQSLAQFFDMYQDTFPKGHRSVLLIPNAVDILRDKLPPFTAPYDEEDYLAKAKAALAEDLWVDAGSVLRQHTDTQLYYRTDHHWTTEAAFYVYQNWAAAQKLPVRDTDHYEIRTVTDAFEGTIQSKLGIHTVTDSIDLYLAEGDPFYTVQKNGSEEVDYSIYDYSAIDTKDKYAVFFGGNQALVKISTRAKSDRRFLVIQDSYAHCFLPFLFEDASEIDVVDLRYYNQKLSDLIAEGNYTDVLFLYNVAGFAEDTSLAKLLG